MLIEAGAAIDNLGGSVSLAGGDSDSGAGGVTVSAGTDVTKDNSPAVLSVGGGGDITMQSGLTGSIVVSTARQDNLSGDIQVSSGHNVERLVY